MSHGRGACQRCGGPKEAGQGRRFCDACDVARQPEKVEAERRRNAEKGRRQRTAAGVPRRVFRQKDAPPGTAWCSKCQQYKPIPEFPPNAKRPSGIAAYCRPCYQEYLHTNRLKNTYDMTAGEYQALLEAQDGRCAICMSVPRSRRLAVDHDHKTGEIRGLLCSRCNHKVLGAARENPNILRRAAEYLEGYLKRPEQAAPTSVFGKAVDRFLADRGASLAGIEVEYKARFTKDDIDTWAEDLRRQAILSGRYRWALFCKRPGRDVRDAVVIIPLWVMCDLLADDFGAVRPAAGEADTKESVA